MFSVRQVAFVVQVEVLPPGQCAPGYQPFYVQAVGRVGTPVADDACPDGTVEQAPRLLGQVIKCDTRGARGFRQVGQFESHAFFFRLEGAIGYLPIGLRRQVQDDVGGVARHLQ